MMGTERTPALVAVCMGFFLIQLDATIVNVALPAVQRSVGGSLAGLQWVVDAYALALAAAMLTAGSRADAMGARRVFLIGLGVFTVGSAACALAPSLPLLVVARVAQGLGAAALLPCSLALIVHLFPDRAARARALSVWGGIAGVGLAAGPVLGGTLVTLVSWRMIFLVNVPICLVTALLVRAWVGETPRQRAASWDPPGMALGMGMLGCLTGGFIEAGQLGWTAPLVLGSLALGLGAAAAFLQVERRHVAPMVPLQIFGIPAFSAAVGVGILFNFCFYGALLCLSLFLQRGLGQSSLRAGVTILPLTVAIGIGATASGRLTARLGPGPPMIAGMACAAIGAGLLSAAGPVGPVPLLVAGEVALGSCSLAMPAMTSVAVNALGSEWAGLASGILNAARQMGGALGVAMLGTLLASPSGRPLLHLPLLVAASGYLVAIALSWIAIRPRPTGSEQRRRRELASTNRV
jgi:MFS transporter, DHA2 family, methylenomycin A resistance protein